MGDDWKNNIVTYIDLIGIKELIEQGNSVASLKMQEFHKTIFNFTKNEMKYHENAYIWNDSVVLLAYIDDQYLQVKDVMQAADNIKKKIDQICNSYAISVKGKSFPEPSTNEQPKFVFLKATSYAFANCFKIEDELGEKYKKPWYVDGRISKKIQSQQTFQIEKVSMRPNGKKRNIFLYDGYLWP